MDQMPTPVLAFIIVLVFVWRFARTRRLYLTSLAVKRDHLALEPFNPRDPRILFHQALIGRRSIEPESFFIRAVVVAVVGLCLLPFKSYGPCLWWLVITLIVSYVLWCIAHGMTLHSKTKAPNLP
jgi:hypothetical protein